MVSFMKSGGKQSVFCKAPLWKSFFPLLALLCCGIQGGAAAGVFGGIFKSQHVLPLVFSGIPFPEAGFFSCFSTLLLNMLIGLLALFLFGMTAFGMVAVPLFLFVKGMAIGLGVLSFIIVDGLPGMGRAAFLYAPVTAVFSLLLLLFAGQAMAFSKRLARAGLTAQEDGQDFHSYLRDFLVCLSFSVMAAFVGALFSVIYGEIFL